MIAWATPRKPKSARTREVGLAGHRTNLERRRKRPQNENGAQSKANRQRRENRIESNGSLKFPSRTRRLNSHGGIPPTKNWKITRSQKCHNNESMLFPFTHTHKHRSTWYSEVDRRRRNTLISTIFARSRGSFAWGRGGSNPIVGVD